MSTSENNRNPLFSRNRLQRRSFLKGGVVLGASSILLAACGKSSTTNEPAGTNLAEPIGTPQPGGTLNLAGADVPNYDYQISFSVLQTLYTNRVFRYKTGGAVNPNQYEIINDLAASYEQPSPEQLIIKLKPGVKFHNKPPVNGRVLDSEDVKATLELVRTDKPNYVYRYLSDFLTSIDTPDASTVSLKSQYATPLIFNSLAYYNSAIAAKEVISRDGNLQKLDVGTGPFILDKYEKAVGFDFIKNPAYFQPNQPNLDKVALTVFADENARLDALRTGKLDAADVSIGLQDAAKQTLDSKSFSISEEPGVGWGAFWFNADKAPFNDLRVRQAFGLALDRNLFNTLTSQGKGVVRVGPVARGWEQWSRTEAQVQADAKRDVAKAKQLLAAAGFPNGLDVEWLGSDNGVMVPQAQVAQQQVKDAGFNMTLKIIDYTALNAELQNQRFTLSHWTIRAYPDPDDYLYPFFYPNGAKNFGKVNDKTLADLILRERQETDAEKRKQALQEIDRRWVNDFAYAHWTVESPFMQVYSKKLSDYAPRNPQDYAGLASAFFKSA